MGRYSLILITGFAIVAGVMRLSQQQLGKDSAAISSLAYEQKAARGVAHSAAQISLEHLKRDLRWRDGFSSQIVGTGEAAVEIVDALTDTTLGKDTVRVICEAQMGEGDATVIMKVALGHPDFPSNVNSGITANSNVGTLGNMIVDGRDHDLNGNLIADNGVYAIRTTDNYVCGGSTALGGTTDAGSDYGLVRTNYGSIVEENMILPGSYPATPEAVLGGASAGLWNGALKSIALSGANGSQYVTDPTHLRFPLAGVTYVELPYAGEWNPVEFTPDDEGILVVHNPYSNSVMKNLNTGVFKGMIIADDVVHIHSTIIGAMFLLSEFPSEGNCIGNGSGYMLFSHDAVIKALEDSGVGLTNVTVLELWE